ncbi:MAG: acyl carrier protein [Candidatus Accumulibacter phosphatis]|uniref:acyl carrier protein n=1 Tax=Candidatus Accumulibacter phosphatis TaxID=327160 RepID=UPI001A57507C|nr:acyl carrier protein [Candidatus Accumulibacter phosphatis]
MEVNAKQDLRNFLKKALENHRDHKEFADDESLFVSGRLDSFSMMTLVMYLEEAFGLDFSDFEFDVNLVDSVNAIEVLVDAKQAV